MNIQDNVFVITGAGSGIGQALAINIAQAGGHLALVDLNASAIEETRNKINIFNVNASVHIVDVSNKNQVVALAQEVIAHHGKVNACINNAGVALMESVDDIDYVDFEWIFNINFWGVVYCTKAFLPFLKEQSEARIVNISSIAGLAGLPVQAAYCATKFAIRGFSESLSLDLSDTSVGVSCVHPGGVKTNIVANARYYKNPDKIHDKPDQKAAAERFINTYAISTSDSAAKKIINGIKKNKKRIIVGPDAKFVDFISRLSPHIYPKIIKLYSKYAK